MNTDIWTPRVTVAAVIERDGRFLLVEERASQGKVLNQPAGHLEDGESLLHAVVRETREETGWRFEPRGLTGIYRWRLPDVPITYLRFCFHGACSDHRAEQPLDADILRTHWMTRAALVREGRPRSPMVLACIDDYLSGHSVPLEMLREL
jgi:8-oxo-dGTP pyrophosphatase MutT (NUDIX family)